MGADDRMSVLEQDHFKYDEYNVMDIVIMGNRRLYEMCIRDRSEKYQNEQKELETKIRQLHETMEAAVQTAADAEKWIALMKQYVNCSFAYFFIQAAVYAVCRCGRNSSGNFCCLGQLACV